MTTKELISKIIVDHPYLSWVLLGLKLIEINDREGIFPPGMTDGKILVLNNNMDEKRKKVVLLHEVFHNVFKHPWSSDRSSEFIVACELVTNGATFFTLMGRPEDYGFSSYCPLCDDEYELKDNSIYYCREHSFWCTAELKKEILKKAKKEDLTRFIQISIDLSGINSNSGSGACNENSGSESSDKDSDSHSSSSIGVKTNGSSSTRRNKEIYDVIQSEEISIPPYINATLLDLRELISKIQGNIPGELKRIAEVFDKPEKLPWNRLLEKKLSYRSGGDYTRLNLRHPVYLNKKVLVIGEHSSKSEVIVAVDISGSISEKELSYFLGIIKDMFLRNTIKAKLVFVDVSIQAEFEMNKFDYSLISRYLKGGGGTDFRSFFEKYGTMNKTIVFLTDGYATYPSARPKCRVIWLVTSGGQKPPWGEVIWLKETNYINK